MDLDGLATRIVLGFGLVIALAQACAGCSAEARSPAITIEDEPERPVLLPERVIPAAAVTIPGPEILAEPNRCDPLILRESAEGPALSKRLPDWLKSPSAAAAKRAEVRRIIATVGDELGADDLAVELLYRKAISESSANPGSIHVHGPDVDAGVAFASYGREHTSERWADARVPVFVLEDGELVQARTARGNPATYDAWALGRGLYGMVTPLYVPRYWSVDAPPWSLCDPVVATVVAIWSARKGLAQCKTDSMRSAYRWLSAGTCREREPDKERRFDRLARGHVRGLELPRIDPRSRVDFGDRWPMETSDRVELLAKLRTRIAREAS